MLIEKLKEFPLWTAALSLPLKSQRKSLSLTTEVSSARYFGSLALKETVTGQ